MARHQNSVNQQRGQGTGLGLWWALLWSLSLRSLHFGWGGRKLTFKLERMGNIPRLCRVRDKRVSVYLSILCRQKMAPNVNGVGLGEGHVEGNSEEGWYSRCQHLEESPLSSAFRGALN